MSIHTAFNGVRRYKKGETAFVPDTMIDVLYNYDDFLNGADQMSKKNTSLSDKRIAVIGGGIAGLISTLELLKCGAAVDLYEATDRLGGRMRSVYPNGTNTTDVFELGCMRFPPSSKTLFHYFDELGISTTPNFPDPGSYGTNAELYYQNTSIKWPGPKNESDPHTLPNDPLFQKIGKDFGAMLVHLLGSNVIENMRTPEELREIPSANTTFYEKWSLYQNSGDNLDKIHLIEAWQALIERYWDISYYDAIYELGQDPVIVGTGKDDKWTIETMNAFGALGVGSGGFGPLYENGFIEILRIMVNGWEDKQRLVEKGITSFTEALIAKIEEIGGNRFKKVLNFPITLASGDGDDFNKGLLAIVIKKIYIYYEKNFSEIYNSCILTMSSNALEIAGGTLFKAISVTTFSKSVNTATRNLHMMRSSKLFVEVKQAFWKETEADGTLKYPNNIQSDELFRGLYCLDYKDSGNKGVVLVSYTWEDDSTKLLGLSNPKDRFDKFIKVLRSVNRKFADRLKEEAVTGTLNEGMIDWQKEAYYYGAFKLNYPGQENDNHAVYFQPWNNKSVYLAGDSMSFAGGWLEGPITSALNAVAALIHDLNLATDIKLRDNNPWSNISEGMYTYNPNLFKEFSEKDKTSEK